MNPSVQEAPPPQKLEKIRKWNLRSSEGTHLCQYPHFTQRDLYHTCTVQNVKESICVIADFEEFVLIVAENK